MYENSAIFYDVHSNIFILNICNKLKPKQLFTLKIYIKIKEQTPSKISKLK